MKAERLALVAGELDLRVFRYVEEIGASQMRVAVGISGPEVPRVDRRRNGGFLGVVGIVAERSLDVFEVPPDVGDHHMADAELGRCVPRLQETFHESAIAYFARGAVRSGRKAS